jgi:FtsP/CotA-like multicopper oxidase with cupredoxin domain
MAEPRRGVSRRGFLALGALAAAGAAAPVGWSAVAGSGPADGPALPELPDLPLVPDADGALTGELVAGVAGDGLGYRGVRPGPLVRLREGDRVRLRFRNGLDVPSSLHLHGLPLAPAVDAPLTHLEPGGAGVQEFTVPAGTAGTHWYHPHAHGDVERQLLAGLAGALVVTGPTDDLPGLAGTDDRLLMVTRMRRELVVNGALRPVVTARAGRTRLRLLNATAGDHLLVAAVRDGRREPLHLVVTDGGAIERPVELSEVLLAPGERAEVLVESTRPGRVALTALPYSANGAGGPASAELRLATLQVPAGLAPVPLPGVLRAVEELDPAAAVQRRRLVLGGAADGTFTIDGHGFDHHRTDLHARLGSLELWDVVNDHATDHPFHLHSYPVQLLARDGVPERFRAWRDTVNVPAGGAVTLAVPLRGAAGRTVYHCHVASHEDLGMVGVLAVA